MKTRYLLIVVCAMGLLASCGGSGKGTSGTTDGKVVDVAVETDKPLNISVYLDLSDRLTRDLNPSQKERDLAIVGHLADYFTAQTIGPRILQSKNTMKVFFYPTPNTTDIATLAEDLTIDITKYNGVEKRKALDAMKGKFQKNLNIIYDKTIQDNNWPGCDIWDFFSSGKVDAHCVRKGFRNILVILTDGYLYDENHKLQEGDAYSYVTPATLKNPNATLLTQRKGLEDLEVRILEVNPTDIQHRDRLVTILENWLKDMGVKQENITVSETDLPVNTRTIVDSFLN